MKSNEAKLKYIDLLNLQDENWRTTEVNADNKDDEDKGPKSWLGPVTSTLLSEEFEEYFSLSLNLIL